MLESLYIENAAVAKQISCEFGSGFSVITGETGSGKSVMIDCLQMITGARIARDIVRSGEQRALVTAVFSHMDESAGISRNADVVVEPDENGEIMITRTVSADGKSMVKINGRPSTLSVLRECGPALMGINTQDERSFLSDRGEYTALLDAYAGDGELLKDYRDKYERAMKKRSEIETLKNDFKEKTMLIDILSYQLKEIDSAKLTDDGEEEKLTRLRAKLKSAERVAKYRKIVTKALSQSSSGVTASYLIERAVAALSQLSDVVEGAPEMIAKLNEFRYEIIDIADTVAEALELDIDGDPAEQLDKVETRLSLIERLKRKYGDSIGEIKSFRADAAAKLKRLEASDDVIAELEGELKSLMSEAEDAALRLREARLSASATLSSEVSDTLNYLDMPKTRFLAEVLPNTDGGETRLSSDGGDIIDFKISINPGEPMLSLSKVASGGEMSRVMLALRSSLNKKSGSETVVFDEIDAGVSGSTSERIGIMLKKLSEKVQVICVTHSPQIAALADCHYLIRKTEINGRAESSITLLDYEERIEEISRIIGGINVTEKQRAAAREMLRRIK